MNYDYDYDVDRRTPGSTLPRHRRPVAYGAPRPAPGSVPRLNGLAEPRPYRYQGTGEDTLTPWMDDDPAECVPPVSLQQDRAAALAELSLWDGSGPVCPAGYVTAREAAAMLGVSVRTVERYKRHLRSAS
jgi:hypothetical protein